MANSNSIIQQFSELKEQDKSTVVEHVLGIASTSIRERQKDFEIGIVSDLYDEIQQHAANWGKRVGLSTDNWVLDQMTMGLAPGEVIVIGGATSNGKTAVSLNIAANVAMQDKRVLFVTLEMTKVEVGVRLKKIMGYRFEEFMANIAWQQNDELNWKSVDGLMEKAKRDFQVDLVVIDHLHYFTRELHNVAEDLGNITKEFKKNAIRHGLPVILISHTRKGSDKDVNKTTINDLRGSSYIAQDADIVLMVTRDNNHPDMINIALAKNRNRYGCKIDSDYFFEFKELKLHEPAFNPNFGK